jgi:hypothetical protein
MTVSRAGNAGAQSRRDTATKRAESLVLLYHALGPTRSLERLTRHLAGLGLGTSLKTLKTYSANYDWQARVRELDQAQAETQQAEHLQLISDMNSNQARLGAALQSVSALSLRNISVNPILSARDTGYLAEVGSRLERLARGEATTRQEVAVQMVAPLIQNIVVLFQDINAITDPARRLREFGMGADRILEEAIGPLE